MCSVRHPHAGGPQQRNAKKGCFLFLNLRLCRHIRQCFMFVCRHNPSCVCRPFYIVSTQLSTFLCFLLLSSRGGRKRGWLSPASPHLHPPPRVQPLPRRLTIRTQLLPCRNIGARAIPCRCWGRMASWAMGSSWILNQTTPLQSSTRTSVPIRLFYFLTLLVYSFISYVLCVAAETIAAPGMWLLIRLTSVRERKKTLCFFTLLFVDR